MGWKTAMLLELFFPIFIYMTNLWPFSYLKRMLSKQLGKPGDNRVARYIMTQIFETVNEADIQLAVDRCNFKPSDQVLEVGFGPGVALELASKIIKKSEGGIIHGVDHSQSMVDTANQRLQKQISEGLVELHLTSVDKLPFEDDTFDKIYHSNCHFFWKDCESCCRELLRVLKPSSVMIAVHEIEAVAASASIGLLSKDGADVDNYMIALQNAGFINVSAKEVNHSNKEFYCIYAYSRAETSQ